MKRKNANNSDTKATKKGKANDGASVPKDYQTTTKLKTSSPEDVLQSLIGDVQLSEFLTKFWEKKPLHVQRKDPKFYGSCFTLDALLSILQSEEIHYDTDINVCRYVEGTKEMLNSDGKATEEDIKELFEKEGATIQFHQPQRFAKELWYIMEKMEGYFGNLVGANVYITPPKTTGLAPHYDDVEVFILQLEGSKKWKLYEPHVELARTYSEDLEMSDIGKPMMEVTMEPGDMLYFPRGTIHHAEAQDNHSTHVTISTYQNNTWGDFLSVAMTTAIDKAMESNVDFRRGLPINFSSFLGTCLTEERMNEIIEAKDENVVTDKKTRVKETDERVLKFKATLKELLNQLIDHIDPHSSTDVLSSDFVASRLPPVTVDENEEDSEESLSLESSIQLRHKDHIRLVVCDNDDDSSDEEEEVEEEDEDMEKSTGSPDKGKKTPEKDSPKKNGSDGKRISKRSKATNGDHGSNSERKRGSEGSEKEEASKTETNGDESDDDDDDFCIDGPFVKLMHSLNNEQCAHMIGEEKEAVGLRFPLHFGKALYQLLHKVDEYIVVKELPLTDEDKLHLASSLWSEGLVKVKQSNEA